MQIPFLEKLQEYKSVRKIQKHWLSFAFFFGFLVDNITLNRVDQIFDNVILATYVLLSMVGILVLYAGSAEKFSEKMNERAKVYAPLFVQFAFGGLLSGMLIFYGRSGDWSQSWPFLLIILYVIYGNETIKERASRLVFNLAIFFIGIFSYVVLLIPVLTGYMGALVFVGSGLIALMVTYGLIQMLFKIIPNFLAMQMRVVTFTLGAIFVLLNTFYFTNIIPPIPLSLKHVGIYHSVVRFDAGEYQLKYEDGEWWQPFKKSDKVFHPQAGGNIFCFAKVFAPTKLETDIFHKWEYKNAEGDWVEHFRTSYAIAGGSDGGYRGYTLVQNFQDGKWRCSVETGRGQVLGRRSFTVDSTEPPAELVTRTE